MRSRPTKDEQVEGTVDVVLHLAEDGDIFAARYLNGVRLGRHGDHAVEHLRAFMNIDLISLKERCVKIRERLAEFRNPAIRQRARWLLRKKIRRAFGAERRRFLPDPPLLEPELEEWERIHRVELPADYRAFLINVGKRGAGPYYGLLGLENATTLFADLEERDRWLNAECFINDGVACTSPDWLESVAGADWEDRWDRDELHPFQGTLPLSDVGCCYYYVLLLSGASRGRVCGVCRDFATPLFPQQQSFLDWYEAWLDAVELGRDDLFEN